MKIPKSILFLFVFIFYSISGSGQIVFEITDDGSGGINVVASGTTIVPSKGVQFYNLGIINFGCEFEDEDFADLCLNGFQSTLNDGPFIHSTFDDGCVGGSGPGIIFNGISLDEFCNRPTSFSMNPCNTEINCVEIPGSDGATPISASGSMNFPIPFSHLPASPGPGEVTIIDIYDQGAIIFRISNTEEIPTLSQWGIIALSFLLLIFGLVGLKQRKVIFG